MAISESSCIEKKKEERLVNDVLERKNTRKSKKNSTCLMTFEMAVPEGSCIEKKKEERLMAFLKRKKNKIKIKKKLHLPQRNLKLPY
jgi:hypothetical protein